MAQIEKRKQNLRFPYAPAPPRLNFLRSAYFPFLILIFESSKSSLVSIIMKNSGLILAVFLFIFSLGCKSHKGHEMEMLLEQLDNAISDKQTYMDIKEQRISNLKQLSYDWNLSYEQQYKLNKQLVAEYEPYISDSALNYIEKNLGIASNSGDTDLINETKVHYASILSVLGMYLEALEKLNSIKRSEISEGLKRDYYSSYGQVYSYLSDYSIGKKYSGEYKRLAELYRDSSSVMWNADSVSNPIIFADRLIARKEIAHAREILIPFYSAQRQDTRESAIAAYQLAYTYKLENNSELQKKYLILSATSDIKSAVKENASIRELALIFYEEGNINRAYEYMKSALDDATFCNARLRTIYITQALPIIDHSYRMKNEKQKKQLVFYLTLISVLSVFLFITLGFIYRQMKKLSMARKQLDQANIQLSLLNENLLSANEKQRIVNQSLSESNRIKEEYIGQFMNLCSSYIDKLEEYRKLVNRKITAHQIDELLRMSKSSQIIETELKEFYANFDSTFLHLFPTFVEEFNNLLIPEEHFIVKTGELLNSELRIFALIRLGITDSFKIASFLRFSSQTIYNYRTKVKNKAIGAREDFENNVLKIGTFTK